MSTQITTLVENHPDEHKTLENEHGISFLIRHNMTTVVFDTGQSDRFLRNAASLNEDLSSVDHVVLSHGHYDHTNGLPYLVQEITADFTLHVHRDLFDPKYVTEGLSAAFRGPSWTREWIEKSGVTVRLVEGTGYEVVPGVHIVTRFDHPHPLEEKNPRFVIRRPESEELEVDDFRDEISLVVETEKGLIVIVGCSHPGIMNMLDTVNARFEAPIFAVLGGTHLVEAHGKRLEATIGYFSHGKIGKLGV